jgi:hypothetical protein
MKKKLISIFTMVAFIVFSLSCTTTKIVILDADAAQKAKKGGILRVVMTSREIIEFSKDQPGRIYNGSIIGRAVKVIGELDKAYIKGEEKDKEGKIMIMIVSIPISEVELVSIKEVDTAVNILAVIGVIGAGIVFFMILLHGFKRGMGAVTEMTL